MALLTGSALTKWGAFEAGRVSAADPKYTVVPQRERLRARAAGADGAGTPGTTAGHTAGDPASHG